MNLEYIAIIYFNADFSMIKQSLKNIIRNVYWKAYGTTIRNPKINHEVKSILFICKGNICRSPFAEMYSKFKYSHSGQYNILSAGIHAASSQVPPIESVNAANNFGIDLKSHRTRLINYRMIESFDLIVAMEAWQYNYLRNLFVEYRNRIFLLPLIGNNNINDKMSWYYKYNIIDPYGKPPSEYIKCYNRIIQHIDILFENINGK